MAKKPKLLIVEDDEWILKIFSKVFEKKFEINLAQTIRAFYSLIENNAYDGFIIDLSLRGEKNGLQLIEELRQMENYLKTPIVVVTANALRKDRENSLKAGATKYITKPVDNKILLQEVLDLYPNL
ncbi:MAG: response regulator [Ignavibacteriales bacterium]|nr:response regulator [Ignavibacteriales bacterium]